MNAPFPIRQNAGNPLKAWLKTNGRTAKHFAGMIGVTPGHLSRLIIGKMPVTQTMALAIAKATDDAVPVAAWGADVAP